MSKNTQISELINYISVDGSGNVVFTTVPAAASNTDKFLVSDAGTLKFRTAAQLLSDIGAQASGSYQTALSGTGFVKISGSTISYDNSTYLTTSSASSTYLPLVGGTLTGGLIGTTASFSSFITAQSTGGSGLRIYGSSGTNQWDIYLNSTNLRFSDNTGTGSVVFDRSINGTNAIFTNTISSTKNIVAGESTPLHLNYTSSDGIGPLMRLGSGTQGFWDVQPSNNNQRLTFEWNDSVNVLSLLSSGNVGVGTTTPSTTLTVKGTTIGAGLGKLSVYGGGDENTWNATRNEAIRIGRADVDGSFYHSIWSATGSGVDETAHWLRFYISNANGSSQTLAMTMNGNGNVGIGGITSPGEKLEVNGNINGQIINSTSNVFRFSGNTALSLVSLNTQNVVKINAAGYWGVQLVGANDQGILINNSGQVGIGTASISERLEINGSVRLSDGNADGPQLKLASSGFSDWNIDNFSGSLRAYYGSTEYIRITNGGLVGIGVSPDTKLEVRSGDIKLSDPSSNINAGYEILWASNNGGSNVPFASIQGITTSAGNRTGDIIFKTGNAGAPAEKMRIRSNGGVSIQGSSSYLSMDGGGLSGPPSGLGYGLYPHSGIGLGYYSVAVGHVWYVTATPVSRMYLTSNNLFVGPQQSTTYSERLNVAGGIRIHTGNEWDGVGITASGTRVFYDHTGAEDDIRFQFFGSDRFILYSNGNYGFSGSNVSDARLKNSISSVTTSYIDKINQLELSTFKMNSEPTGSFKMGFIAQQVKTILPEVVTGDETKEHEYLGVDTNGLLALAIKSIQELKTENDSLKDILKRNNIN